MPTQINKAPTKTNMLLIKITASLPAMSAGQKRKKDEIPKQRNAIPTFKVANCSLLENKKSQSLNDWRATRIKSKPQIDILKQCLTLSHAIDKLNHSGSHQADDFDLN
jgi:hypothetical protein